jgi:hypothetical protein
MTARAWPYAVSRGATSGYQAIVVPGFLADAEQAYILEYASRQETSEPGVVTVRDVVGAIEEPLSLVYRVLEVRANRYGLGGTDPLEDRAGRAIRAFEGLVLRLPAERVPSIGLTAADLEAVTAATAPAFRKLWEAGSRIEPEASAALSVGGTTGESPLSLRISEPYVVPGTSAKRRPAQPRRRPAVERAPSHPERTRPAAERAPARPERTRPAAERAPAPSPGRTRPAAERGPARPGRTRLTIAVAAVCVLAALLAWFLLRPSPPHQKPTTATAAVQDLCSDLSSGNVGGAYQLFSDAYRNKTSQQAFVNAVLGSSATARCTSDSITSDHAAVSQLQADGTVRNLTLGLQQQAGQWQFTSMNVSR